MPGIVRQWTHIALVKKTSLQIQLNCIELQPSINILIWVAWLCNHSELTPFGCLLCYVHGINLHLCSFFLKEFLCDKNLIVLSRI
jgi:hypothetical protein